MRLFLISMFHISGNPRVYQAITGEKRMYTLLDGSTFTDGNSRHVSGSLGLDW